MNDTLRAADQDREETVGLLREHYAQGRLTMEEFEERSEAAYAARTLGELRPLVEDLPATSERPAPARESWSPARMRSITVVAVIAAVVVVVSAVFAGHAVFGGHAVFALPTWLVVLVAIKLVYTGRRGGRRGLRR